MLGDFAPRKFSRISPRVRAAGPLFSGRAVLGAATGSVRVQSRNTGTSHSCVIHQPQPGVGASARLKGV